MQLWDYHPDVSDAVWGRGLKKVWYGLGMVSFSLVPNLLALSVTPLMRWLLCSSELAFGSLSRPQLYPWRPAVSPVNSPLLPDRPHRPSDANLEIGGRPEICTQTEAEMDTNEDRRKSRHGHADGCVLAEVICYLNRTDVNSSKKTVFLPDFDISIVPGRINFTYIFKYNNWSIPLSLEILKPRKSEWNDLLHMRHLDASQCIELWHVMYVYHSARELLISNSTSNTDI